MELKGASGVIVGHVLGFPLDILVDAPVGAFLVAPREVCTVLRIFISFVYNFFYSGGTSSSVF
jgi:hypothetical protein